MKFKNCQICQLRYSKQSEVCLKQWAKSKFCSRQCMYMSRRGIPAHNKAQVEKTCETCDENFMVPPYRKDSARFCSLKCHGVTRVGTNGINWRGGLTPINRAIRTSDRYKEWRTAVFKRDNFTCTKCGDRGAKLEADHIQLFSQHPELRFELSNGQTLCRDCHKAKTRQDLRLNWSNQFAMN